MVSLLDAFQVKGHLENTLFFVFTPQILEHPTNIYSNKESANPPNKQGLTDIKKIHQKSAQFLKKYSCSIGSQKSNFFQNRVRNKNKTLIACN